VQTVVCVALRTCCQAGWIVPIWRSGRRHCTDRLAAVVWTTLRRCEIACCASSDGPLVCMSTGSWEHYSRTALEQNRRRARNAVAAGIALALANSNLYGRTKALGAIDWVVTGARVKKVLWILTTNFTQYLLHRKMLRKLYGAERENLYHSLDRHNFLDWRRSSRTNYAKESHQVRRLQSYLTVICLAVTTCLDSRLPASGDRWATPFTSDCPP